MVWEYYDICVYCLVTLSWYFLCSWKKLKPSLWYIRVKYIRYIARLNYWVSMQCNTSGLARVFEFYHMNFFLTEKTKVNADLIRRNFSFKRWHSFINHEWCEYRRSPVPYLLTMHRFNSWYHWLCVSSLQKSPGIFSVWVGGKIVYLLVQLYWEHIWSF